MAKSERNKLLITLMLIAAGVMLIPGAYFVYRYYSSKQSHYVKFSEKSSVDYKVCLKENKFYEEKCLDKNNQYIASLIKDIPIEIKYDSKLSGKDLNFKYAYKIDATLDVIDKNNKKQLFTKKEILFESDKIDTKNEMKVNYNLDIDYNKYNDTLSSFVTIYDLDETVNTLKINLTVETFNDEGKSVISGINNPVVSLSIPLTRKTINVDINSVESTSDTDVLVANKTSKADDINNIIGAGLCLAISMILVIYVIYYYMSTRTVLEIYQSRIKKITSTYDSYIQRINGRYPIGASQICKVASFNDMLEIKDSSDKPLLMLENESKTGTFFLIPIGEGVIYTYALRVEDIMAEKDGTIAPDYGVEDIGTVEEEKVVKTKPKKYTKEKIKEDIEKTTSLNIIDDENAIKGTKGNDENLYEQLSKTAVFKAIGDEYYFPEVKVKRKVKKKSTKSKKSKK